MRSFLLACVFCSLAIPAFSYTFIMKSGKRVEGIVLYEESSVLRIRDITGVEMSLKKSSLDWNAIKIANPPKPPQAQQPATAAVASPAPAKRPVKVYRSYPATTRETKSFSSLSEKELKDRIRSVERSYERLKAQCRNAGTGPSLKKNLETHYYKVDGKTVKVTGYWAHSDSVRDAKLTCQKAIDAESSLAEARQVLQTRSSSAGAGSAAGLP